MSIEALIKEKIEQEFNPEEITIINESDLHIGHAGHDGSGDSHFKLMVVSSSFDGYSRIQRHKMVMSSLKELFSQGLHAITLDLKAP